jgi:hypothetical protein
MTKRKKRARRPSSRPGGQGPAASASQPRGGANVARRERKEQARAAREAQRKRAARSAAARRAAIFTGLGLAAFGIILFIQRASGPRPLPESATAAITAASCRYDPGPADSAPGGNHLPAGSTTTYPSVPATSGAHDQASLGTEPRVYDEPVPEINAVHFLEHSGVIAYYRPDGDSALDQATVDRLATTAEGSKNLVVAPRTDLPDDTSLSVTAWNKVVNCGAAVTADQATAITRGFVEAFACTSNAPEPQQGEDC